MNLLKKENTVPINLKFFEVVDKKSVSTLISIFREELIRDKELLRKAFAEKDSNKVHYYTHKIHGACSFFGARKLAKTAKKLEKTIYLNKPVNDHEMIDLQQKITEVENYLLQIPTN